MTHTMKPYRVQLLLDAPASVPPGAPVDEAVAVRVVGGVPLEAQTALSQTWDWPGAPAAMARVRDAMEITLTPGDLDRRAVLARMQAAVEALLEQVETVAIHWVSAERLVSVESFRDAMAHGGAPADHAINVRLFRVGDGRSGEGLMDTRGLSAFGLPDLECHFVGLELGDVGRLLMAYAEYAFEKGDVLHDDAMVRGVRSHEEWECKRGRAKALPDRDVVAFVPSAPHAP
ncbi:MAG: hypothetical protein RL199_180 [Pseudomonadota bacterium]|jgi:hypothetical protein